MKPARILLLDRDGTITQNSKRPGDYINDPGEIELIPGVGELLKAYKEDGWDIAVLSNQGGVEKGYISMDKCVQGFRRTMALAPEISVCYFCPAGPDSGSDGMAIRVEESSWTRVTINRDLGYRKPRPGMALEALNWFDFPSSSQGGRVLYVGDRPEDRAMAANAELDFRDAEQWRRTPIHEVDSFFVPF